MKRLALLAFPILLLTSLTSCGGPDYTSGSGSSYKKGDKIYQERILFDTSDESARDASIYLGVKSKVSSVKLGRNEIKFRYTNKLVLTLPATELKAVGPGEKTANVTFSNGKKVSVEILNANKFIKTANDLQSIGESKKACEGVYVLANDIDCSSIDNFEPIGEYFDETDPNNFYFHGILDGDGYAIKNVTCSYSDSPVGPSGGGYNSNYDVYSGNPKFESDAHKAGDNIGIFQVIGSSGVVRNITFDNCDVHGRTIVGVVAGNIMGRAENLLIKSNCSVKMDTHFYDDDCNTGAAFGIVAGSGNVQNVISLTSNISMLGIYEDYAAKYIGEIGNGWDHSGIAGNTDPWWRFVSVSKEIPGTTTKITDSNGKLSNGIYSVVGKCWGTVLNSVGASFTVVPYGETGYTAAFGHTHNEINKPDSGGGELGMIDNCAVYSSSDLKKVETYSQYQFSEDAWNFEEGSFPSLKENINRFEIAK